MSSIRTDSHKPKTSPDQSYSLGAHDLEAAIEPHVRGDIYLSVRFHPQQSSRKAERDGSEALGEYRLLDCRYSPDGSHLTGEENPKLPWESVPDAQVVVAEVFSVPTSALIKGVGMQKPLRQLLGEGLAELASKGLPASDSQKNAWIFELGFDSRVHTLQARLRPWNGGDYAVSRKIDLVLPPVGVRRRV